MTGLGVPLPAEPIKSDFDFDDPLLIECEDGRIRPQFITNGDLIKIIATSDFSDEDTLWTLVYWARKIGVPGVHKERVEIGNYNFRLGALYRYAGFDLTERESNYIEYGEWPLQDDQDIGHGNGIFHELT